MKKTTQVFFSSPWLARVTSNEHVEVIHIFVRSFHPKLSQGLTGWEVQAGPRDAGTTCVGTWRGFSLRFAECGPAPRWDNMNRCIPVLTCGPEPRVYVKKKMPGCICFFNTAWCGLILWKCLDNREWEVFLTRSKPCNLRPWIISMRETKMV
jgi:hypothetical protein